MDGKSYIVDIVIIYDCSLYIPSSNIHCSFNVCRTIAWLGGGGGEGGMICLDGYRMKVRDGTTVYVYRKVRSHRSGTQNTLHIVPILTDVQYACVKFFG